MYITDKIIRAAFEVHKFLGNGFQEVIYQRALAYELKLAGLDFQREMEQEIFYKNTAEPIGTRRADFVVEQKVLVELKAIITLEDVHTAQNAKLSESPQGRSRTSHQFRFKELNLQKAGALSMPLS